MTTLTAIEPSLIVKAINEDDKNKYEIDITNTADFNYFYDKEYGETIILKNNDVEYTFASTALKQYLSRLGIPIAFWKRLDNEDRKYNFNQLSRKVAKDITVKCRKANSDDGTDIIRGVLSPNVNPLDNRVAFQYLREHLERSESSNIVEFNLNDIYFDFRTVFGEGIDVGNGTADPLYSGVLVSNSEITTHNLNVDAMVYRLVCENGMVTIQEKHSFIENRHQNNINDDRDFHAEIDSALWDAIAHAKERVQVFGNTQTTYLNEDDLDKYSEKFHKTAKVDEDFMIDVHHRIEGIQPLTLYQFLNAVTAAAQNLEGTDRYRVERDAGDFLLNL